MMKSMKNFLVSWGSKQRLFLRTMGILLLFFPIISFLFNLPNDLIFYLSTVFFAIALLSVLFDMYAYVQKKKWIDRSLQALAYGEKLSFQVCSNFTEVEKQLWQHLLMLQDKEKKLQLKQQKEHKELMDYYTLWVHQIKTSIAATDLLIQAMPSIDERPLLEQELVKIRMYTDFVLHYLRMETFHQDLLIKEISIQQMVHNAVKKFASFFIYKRISLHLGDLDYKVITDEKWFGVILEQLLSNAIKYNKEPGEISIYMEQDTLCIADKGIGITSSDQQRIFERGYSGFNGRMNYHSSGLGLYLSKEIANKLNLGLDVQSSVGEGSIFCIHLAQEQVDFE